MFRRTAPALRSLLLVGVMISAGCASYAPHSIEIKRRLASGEFDDALKEVDRAESASSRLLTLYESGLILHYAGDFDASNLQFHEAEALYEDLYTKSLTREVGSLVSSETLIEYRGERFESAFLHYYKILNYLHLGDSEGALVECRKLNQKLQTFRDEGGTFYTDDPFLQYLTGIVHESGGELSDAFVSYRLATQAFEDLGETIGISAPDLLRCDLARVAARLGYRDEKPEYEPFDQCADSTFAAVQGSVVLLLESGFAPRKVPVHLVAPIFKDDDPEDFDSDEYSWTLGGRARCGRFADREVSYWLAIAFPEMVAEPSPLASAEVVAVEAPASARRMAPVADLEAVALERFAERRPRMLAKAAARALAKYLAKAKVEEKQGRLAGAAINIFNVATETADTRSWSTLPRRIDLARLSLPPGTYTLQVVLRDSGGERIETIAIPDVEVAPGRMTFLNHRVF